jgi:hypothetical protein
MDPLRVGRELHRVDRRFDDGDQINRLHLELHLPP